MGAAKDVTKACPTLFYWYKKKKVIYVLREKLYNRIRMIIQEKQRYIFKIFPIPEIDCRSRLNGVVCCAFHK